MITDSINNIDKYNLIPKEVSNFIKGLTPFVDNGRYEIDETSYANVEVYDTRPVDKCRFEAHKKYIDIQILLSGKEELDSLPVSCLNIAQQYDETRDIMFFENSEKLPDVVQLESGKFTMIFPHEAHRPQMISGYSSQKVKKVVVKIKVD